MKTNNSLGLCTLPPSRHRDDPNFRYYSVGREDKIIIDDTLYNRILDLLTEKCLIPPNPNNESDYHDDNDKATKSDSDLVYRVCKTMK